MNRRDLIILGCSVGVWLTAPAILSAQPVLYVDISATGQNNGLSWCDGFARLNDAVQQAVNNPGQFTEIRVAQGTYMPTDEVPGPRTSTFYMANGVKIKGGYKGGLAGTNCNDPSADERNTTLYETTLSGNINDPQEPTDNCYTVVTGQQPNGVSVGTLAELDGFTITAGYGGRGGRE